MNTNSNRNHKHRKNIATQKNSILFKLDLEFHIEFQPLLHPSIYFDMNYDHFGVKSPISKIKLCTKISVYTKLVLESISKYSHWYLFEIICIYCHFYHLYENHIRFEIITLNHWFLYVVNIRGNFVGKGSWLLYIICLIYSLPFFLVVATFFDIPSCIGS